MRVVIADDAPLIREGVARLLTENGVEVVDQVGDADALLRSVRDLRPDVALVDIRMPPTHTDEGLRAAREIRSRYPETAVLVLSQHLEPDYALRLVEEKPERVGYLMKERVGRVEQLLDAVQRVAAGECVVDRAVVDELLARRRRVDPIDELTPREREILALMAEGRSNQGICRALWLSPKTVETHIRGAFAKLGIREAPEDNRRVLAVLDLPPAIARNTRGSPHRMPSLGSPILTNPEYRFGYRSPPQAAAQWHLAAAIAAGPFIRCSMEHLWNTEAAADGRRTVGVRVGKAWKPRFFLRSVATVCASDPMVRRGSTVRVR